MTYVRVLPLLVAAAALAVALRLPTPPPTERPAPARKDSPGEAADYFAQQRAPDGIEVPVERYALALAHRDTLAKSGERGKLGASAWRPAGPPAVGGRTRALLIDPTGPDTLYAAGVSGGVWKSLDGGRSWRSTGDALANLATVSLAFDPADARVLFAGTGEGEYVNRPVSRSRGVRGDGIFVTRDAGASWRQLAATRGNPDFDYVNRLVFDASGRLHAATRTGIHVSSDLGASWSRTLAPPNGEGCAELIRVPGRNRLLASCGVFSQASIYVGDDGGTTWRAIALPAGSGRTTLAAAPSSPDVVYAVTAHVSDYNLLRLARSDDGGATWATVLDRTTADPLSALILSNPIASTEEGCVLRPGPGLGQGWFDNVVAVDPRNPSIVWVGGVDLFRSDDGGRTFRIASRWWSEPGVLGAVHGDQHAIAFDPRYDGGANRRMYVANDGGIHSTEDARGPLSSDICTETGTMAWSPRNDGYRVTQFYHGAVSADGTRLIAGAQDNGTQLGTPDGWREVYGGDGAYAAFDPRDPRRWYVSAQFADLERTDDGGESFVSIRSGLPGAIANYAFIHPFELDPGNPDTLYTGAGARLYRSVNRGASWVPTGAADIVPGGSRISAIAIARGAAGRLALGFESGALARSVDGGTTWTVATPRSGFVSSVAFDPADPQLLYATYSTFGGAHVFVSRDGGVAWSALDGESPAVSLPDIPAHVLRIDPRDRQRLWLGTDIGLFVSHDGGRRWRADASGLGNVLIEQLVVAGSGADAELVAFTYGRGAHRARLDALTTGAANPGHAGAWFDPAAPGQGLQLEVVPGANVLGVGWYTYAARDAGANHEWLVGTGALSDDSATVSLFRASGGRFAGSGPAALEPAGTMTIRFADCTSASASYVLAGSTERRGELALSRLTSAAYCEAFRRLGDGALSALATPSNAGDFEYGHGGSWVDPAASHQGFVLEPDPAGGTMVASWYTFDPADASEPREAPTWYTAQGTISGARAELAVFRTVGGGFANANPVRSEPVGTLVLQARSCAAIDASYVLRLADGTTRTGTPALQRVAPATVCEAMAP
ncbi:MAG TPA: hypothetical protein VFO79_04960 [Xanthomonadales bacterium]|nr:hypothetical protein [Xanthomonadales bacterium]